MADAPAPPSDAEDLVSGITFTGRTIEYSSLIAGLLRYYAGKSPIENFHMKDCTVLEVPVGMPIFFEDEFLNLKVRNCSFVGSVFYYQKAEPGVQ